MKPAKSELRPLSDEAPARLAEEVLQRAEGSSRYLVGIAGIPGSGKTTFATALFRAINSKLPDSAALVPMDGFHFTNEQLAQRGLARRKGAPETFDASAYIRLLREARRPGTELYFPIYDRVRHAPVVQRSAQQRIAPATRIVLTEGNYLLLDLEPWRELGDVLDECWFIETPLDIARAWILDRHVRGGKSTRQAIDHYASVDLPNAELVLSHMRMPSLRLDRGAP